MRSRGRGPSGAQRGANDRAAQALPPGFVDHFKALLGDEANALFAVLDEPPEVSIRVNAAKAPGLLALPDPVPWCATGRYLPERPAFTFDPLLHAGGYYVQEASSMLLEQAFAAAGPWPADTLALDLCAAPGGKSTHLRALLPETALLVSNEVVGQRRSVLEENLWKQGLPNTVITGSDARAFASSGILFDLVVVDAPCSGEGLFRREPEARRQWSLDLVRRCAITQGDILHHAWECLAPGGALIYSTCTWEPAENEEQVQRLVERGAEVLRMAIPGHWAGAPTASTTGLCCMPNRTRGEGFHIAVLRKPGSRPTRGAAASPVAGPSPVAEHWLRTPWRWTTMEYGGLLHALDAAHAGTIQRILRTVHVTRPGLPLLHGGSGEQRPHPALALSVELDRPRCRTLEVDHALAERYLRGESLPDQGATGDALVLWRGLALGWVSGAGTRWNNRWPKPWRLRSHRPSAPPVSWPAPTAPPQGPHSTP